MGILAGKTVIIFKTVLLTGTCIISGVMEFVAADEGMHRKYYLDILKDGLPVPGKNPTAPPTWRQ